MVFYFSIFFVLQLVKFSAEDHYRGGTISWKPTNPSLISGPTVDITFTERHSWTFTRYPCNASIIGSLGVYNDTQTATPPTLECITSLAACAASNFITINSPLYCTDFSTLYQISSGTYYTTQTLNISSVIDIAWRGVSWTTETLTNAWSLVSHIDLTPLTDKINTSPVTGSLPIFLTFINVTTIIPILVGDEDNDQVTRCRWSTQTPIDECGDVCLDLTNATLNSVDCFITWYPVLRPADIANNLTTSTYVAAITVEDFSNASSTIPLSSVPHQVLVYVSPRPAGTCAFKPGVSAFPRRNSACYAVAVNSVNNYNFRGSVNAACVNASIVDFISSSPLFANRSDIFQVSNYTWGINIRWVANTNQTGLQPFCVAAVDNYGQTSAQYCVMIMVGSTNPTLYTPQFVQSTASPVGTVMSTQTRFSIQANLPLRRTTLNGTYIYIIRLNANTVARQIDCKISPDVYFLNDTLVFFVTNPPWVPGTTYYITMTQGVATADMYCGTESGGFGGNATWRFTIWDASASSTLTSSTIATTLTTHTVTTRGLGTTTNNPIFTTTGVPAYTTTTVTTTTATTSTSETTTSTTSATTTTTTTTTTTEFIPNADVIYPKDLEQDCLQPITIAAALITIAILPFHLYGMINLFVKMNAKFQQETLRRLTERRKDLQNGSDLQGEADEEEQETLV